jgi:hypothetical protein
LSYSITPNINLVPSANLRWSVDALTRGLRGPDLARALGLEGWRAGTSHPTIFSVNHFDFVQQMVDVTYMSVLGIKAPEPGIYSNGVRVEQYYLGGDPNDGSLDVVAVRIVGPFEAVATVIADAATAVEGQITNEHGTFSFNVRDGAGVVLWNGLPVWERNSY